MRLVARGIGWTLIAAGITIALYLVYALFWTGLETRAAQLRLLEGWELEVGPITGALAPSDQAPTGVGSNHEIDPAESDDLPAEVDPAAAVAPAEQVVRPEVGDAVAALQFVRPGSDTSPVHDDVLFVVEGVTTDALRAGPGHYPRTALPGQAGNFAVADHRTTYGAPFYDLDRIEMGDEIHVTDRTGVRWIYEVVAEEIVPPDAAHVLDADPLSSGRPTLTLTTCNPRFSNAERLIVFATLDGGQTARSGS